MRQTGSPTVRRRRLAFELRRLRDRAQLTLEEVAERLAWSATKVSRIETCRVGVTLKDVGCLLDLYEIDASKREELIDLARDSRKKGWWQAYADLPAEYATYIGLEAETASMRGFAATLVPGLLQTEDYARAVIRAALVVSPPGEIERRVEVRMARQALLFRDDPLRFWTVLDEAAIRRVVEDPSVMRSQFKRLLELAGQPNITMQVLPFAAGAHTATAGGFHILRFPSLADPEVVFVENLGGNLYVEREADVYRYTVAFDHLRAKALSVDDSRRFIAKVAAQLG